MGRNRYGTWDDATAARLEARYERRKRALSERFTAKRNKLEAALERLAQEERAAFRELEDRHRDACDALVTPHDPI